MVRDDLPYSKGRIDRAGRALRRDVFGESPPLSDDESAAEIAVVEAFRAVHRDPLLKARLGLQSCVNTEGLRAVKFGQRLKRMPTIIDKLRRLPTMKLSSMQDIGGCRAVFSTQAEVACVQERFMRNSARRNGADDTVRDYVTNPRSSGYRGVHVWTRYDGRRIEVQLRTERQNGWADAVEDLTGFSVHVWTRYDGRRIEVQLRTERQNGWADGEDLTGFTGTSRTARGLQSCMSGCAVSPARTRPSTAASRWTRRTGLGTLRCTKPHGSKSSTTRGGI